MLSLLSIAACLMPTQGHLLYQKEDRERVEHWRCESSPEVSQEPIPIAQIIGKLEAVQKPKLLSCFRDKDKLAPAATPPTWSCSGIFCSLDSRRQVGQAVALEKRTIPMLKRNGSLAGL